MWRSVMHLRLLAIPATLAICSPAAAETLLIGNKGEDTVSFVDLETGQERARVATGRAPHEIAISPNGKQAAVVAYGGTTLDIFDVRIAALVKRIDIAPNAAPHGIVWLKSGLLVVAAEKSKSVVIVDPRRGSVDAIPTGQAGSHMLVVSPDQHRAYVANILAGTVSVIDLQRKSKVADITVGGNPEGLAITPDGRHLWVGDDSAPRVRVVDLATRQTIETLPTDSIAIRVAISPDGRSAITSNMASGTLNIFDVVTRKPMRTIRVSGERTAMQVTLNFSRDGKRLYVAETGRNTVAEVDLSTGTVLRRITAGRNGDGLGIAP
jgi:YVTN family beta-propeller protein